MAKSGSTPQKGPAPIEDDQSIKAGPQDHSADRKTVAPNPKTLGPRTA